MRLIGRLPRLPMKKTVYRGVEMEEFDLEEALRLKPRLILIDELAHTNVPGLRHKKRYQDVEELLAAGIDVYTTLNVQHLESRADTVHDITAAPVQETVPDSVLAEADCIQLVDIAPRPAARPPAGGEGIRRAAGFRRAGQFFQGVQPDGPAGAGPAYHGGEGGS